MKCKICNNGEANSLFELQEMMYGFRDKFNYIQCSSCECIQIINPPDTISKYYPADYYSYSSSKELPKVSSFRRFQCQSIIGANSNWLGKLITRNYNAPSYYQYLRHLHLYDLSSPILDIGSGQGDLLKDFYRVGYKDLTGIDPYVAKDVVYNNNFRILKKNLFEISKHYDAIMLHHSLEHMDNQHEVFKKLHSILSVKGRILFRIPVVSKPLMDKYGLNVVSLDPPRHFFIHSMKSISLLLDEYGFKIEKIIYDAHEFSFWASEQYQNDISLHNDKESFLVKKTFSDEQIKEYKKEIEVLNNSCESDNVAIYVSKK